MVLFKDHRGHLHCALEIPDPVASITNHRLRGMQCGISTYTIKGKGRTHLIDLVCSLDGFAKEFTAVTKDVAHEVLHNGRGPVDAVTKVLRNWVTFWGQMRGAVLSEDKIIGLYCELLILEAVIAVNPELEREGTALTLPISGWLPAVAWGTSTWLARFSQQRRLPSLFKASTKTAFGLLPAQGWPQLGTRVFISVIKRFIGLYKLTRRLSNLRYAGHLIIHPNLQW